MNKILNILKEPGLLYCRVRMMLNTLCYILFFKKRGRNVKLDKPILITTRCIQLGSNVHIYKNARIEGVSKYGNQTFTPQIIIEDNVGIEQNIHLTCASSIIIKKNTAIANNVTITDINHNYEDVTLPIEQQPLSLDKVEIGEGSKIFSGATILPGVILGKHTVVAANTLVRKGIYPNYCVIAGIPGKVVKIFCFETNEWIQNIDK